MHKCIFYLKYLFLWLNTLIMKCRLYLSSILQLGCIAFCLLCVYADLCVFQLSSALLFDAVHTVVAAVQELNRSQNVGATQLSCKSSKIWEHGTSLMNYLRMVRAAGIAHKLPIISPAAVAGSFII